MQLSPRKLNIHVKGMLRENGVRLTDRSIHPEQSRMREYRRIAQSRFIARLGLSAYPTHIEDSAGFHPDTVTIPLKHGLGRPSQPIVGVGDEVRRGDVIASVAYEDVGCMIHASIGGEVTGVDGGITITRKELTR
jgi:hypothetical protein